MEKLPLLALAAASAIVTVAAQRLGGSIGTFTAYPADMRLANALLSCSTYLVRAFRPAGLAVFYPYRVHGLLDADVLASAALLAGVTAGAILLRRRAPYLLVGWAWYIVTLLPVIGLVQVGAQSMADRYTYVPLIGIFVILSWGTPDLLGAVAGSSLPALWRRRALAAAAVTAAVALMACTWVQVGLWADSVVLLERSIERAGASGVISRTLGITLFERGRSDDAVGRYREALKLDPGDAESHSNLAVTLKELGRLEEAEFHAREAVRLRPGSANHAALGTILTGAGRFDQAAEEFAEALRLDPGYAPALNNFGILLARQGRLDDAIGRFTEALRLNPGDADARRNLDQALALRARGGR